MRRADIGRGLVERLRNGAQRREIVFDEAGVEIAAAEFFGAA